MNKLTLDFCTQVLAHAQKFAATLGKPMTFAIVDASGHLVALHRMDGARFLTPEIALGKAFSAAAFGVPSGELRERAKNLPNFATAITAMTNGKYTPQTGAVPIRMDGAIVGAIGASGGTGEEDEDVCKRAVEAVMQK